MISLADIEKRYMLEAIVAADFDLQKAADALGVSKRTLYRKLILWKLPTPIGGNPHTTKWSEHVRRGKKITDALLALRQTSGLKETV